MKVLLWLRLTFSTNSLFAKENTVPVGRRGNGTLKSILKCSLKGFEGRLP